MSRKRQKRGKPKRLSLSGEERAILSMRVPPKPKGQRSRGTRRGNVFPVRIAPEVRAMLELQCSRDDGPKALGPWMIWRALVAPRISSVGNTGARGAGAGNAGPGEVIPGRQGNAAAAGAGSLVALTGQPIAVPVAERLIVDLCSGSGSWSEPYKQAGYRVRRFTLPHYDVRELPAFDEPVWGVLAAPPCTEFSLAKNGRERDFRAGLETVSACLRLIAAAQPRWWALENPVGLLARFLGRPVDVFDPHEYGDPWTKRTALWGSFGVPARGPHVRPIDGGGPLCSICHPDEPRTCSLADHLAITPPGFARAFCDANP